MQLSNGEVSTHSTNGVQRKRALIIAFEFPPRGGSGIQRTVKFVKYLSHLGWDSTVVAPNWTSDCPDATIESDIPPSTEVIRTGTGEQKPGWVSKLVSRLPVLWQLHRVAKHNLRFPDFAAPWAKQALDAVQRRISAGGVDVLYSTSPPVTTHWVAMKAKAITGLPWVADFRDPWTDNMFYGHRVSRWRQARDHALEGDFYRCADVVIANTDAERELLVTKHRVSSERVVTIPNGYDESDFLGVSEQRPRDVFRVAYCGAAYKDYTPSMFADALRAFLVRRPHTRIEWVMTGSACKWAKTAITDEPLVSRMRLLGYLPNHASVVDVMMSSHLLILVQPLIAAAKRQVPGKLYEYLRSGTQIAAICSPTSEVSRILRTSHCGRAFQHDDAQAVGEFLEQEYSRWERGECAERQENRRSIVQYDRRTLAACLADVFSTVTATDTQPNSDRSETSV